MIITYMTVSKKGSIRKHSYREGKYQHFFFKTKDFIQVLEYSDQKYLENFEMWCWRRMEKISWTDHVRNGEVLLRVDRLCGLVVRVSGYRYRGPGFDSRRYQIF